MTADPARAYTMRSTRARQAAARNRARTAVRRCPDHARGIHTAPCPGDVPRR